MIRTLVAAAALAVTLTACGASVPFGDKPSAEDCALLNQKSAANKISDAEKERLEDC